MRFALAVCLMFLLAEIAPAQCGSQASVPISDDDIQLLDAKARSGDIAAAFSLGMALIYRKDSEHDPSRGVSWLRLAAEKGMGAADFALSIAYRLGCGVPNDETAANAHLLKAAEAGYAPAQYVLAGRQDKDQHYVEAGRWYSKAALQGLPEAQVMLGQLYENGDGVPQDYAKAATLYRTACEHRPDYEGSAGRMGCNGLGLLYSRGDGVKQSKVEAYKFFKLGLVSENIDSVKREMTKTEIAEAERQIELWITAHPNR
jgi:TPR repeat protein